MFESHAKSDGNHSADGVNTQNSFEKTVEDINNIEINQSVVTKNDDINDLKENERVEVSSNDNAVTDFDVVEKKEEKNSATVKKNVRSKKNVSIVHTEKTTKPKAKKNTAKEQNNNADSNLSETGTVVEQENIKTGIVKRIPFKSMKSDIKGKRMEKSEQINNDEIKIEPEKTILPIIDIAKLNEAKTEPVNEISDVIDAIPVNGRKLPFKPVMVKKDIEVKVEENQSIEEPEQKSENAVPESTSESTIYENDNIVSSVEEVQGSNVLFDTLFESYKDRLAKAAKAEIIEKNEKPNNDDSEKSIPFKKVKKEDEEADIRPPFKQIKKKAENEKVQTIERYLNSAGCHVMIKPDDGAYKFLSPLSVKIGSTLHLTKDFLHFMRKKSSAKETNDKTNYRLPSFEKTLEKTGSMKEATIQKQRADAIVDLAKTLSNHGIMSCKPSRSIGTIFDCKISWSNKVKSYIDGQWCEIYAYNTIEKVLKKLALKHKCDYEVMSNVEIITGGVESISDKKNELDVVFRIADKVFMCEVKSGSDFDIEKYTDIMIDKIKLPLERLIILAGESESYEAEVMAYFHDCYVCNTEKFEEKLVAMIERSFGERDGEEK